MWDYYISKETTFLKRAKTICYGHSSFNFKNKFKLCRFLYHLCNTYIRTDMLATFRIPCPLRTASECYIYTYLDYLNFLYKSCDTFIRTDMLATCRIPCPLRTASVNLILTDYLYLYTHGHVGHMPYPMSIAHRKWILYLYLFKLF